MFIPDPLSEFFYPGSRFKKIPNPHQRILSTVLLGPEKFSKLSELCSGMFIPDLELDFLPIPNPRSWCQSWIHILSLIDPAQKQMDLSDPDP